MKSFKKFLAISSILLGNLLILPLASGAGVVTVTLTNPKSDEANCGVKKHVAYGDDAVRINVSVTGMQTRNLRYNYFWSTKGFDLDPNGRNSYRSNYNEYKIKAPKLESTQDSGTLLVGVKVRNSAGEEATGVRSIEIVRPFYLKLDSKRRSCHATLPAQQITGIYVNDSSISRTFTINDTDINGNLDTQGWKKGFSVFLAPQYMNFSLFGMSWDRSYMKSKTQIVQRETSTTIVTEILPEQAAVFFKQTTLLKNHYDVMAVNRCGVHSSAGHSFYNHWVNSYPVAMVDPKKDDPLRGVIVGMPASDNCDSFEQDLADDAEDTGIFYSMDSSAVQ